jgi:hypothetical protein
LAGWRWVGDDATRALPAGPVSGLPGRTQWIPRWPLRGLRVGVGLGRWEDFGPWPRRKIKRVVYFSIFSKFQSNLNPNQIWIFDDFYSQIKMQEHSTKQGKIMRRHEMQQSNIYLGI